MASDSGVEPQTIGHNGALAYELRYQSRVNLAFKSRIEAVVRVYYTERTPSDTVKVVKARLSDKNNRGVPSAALAFTS